MSAIQFEPRSSQSRQTMAAPSVADSLPSISFGFDELRDRMARFTAKFDAFIEQGRKRVLEEKNQFVMQVTELQGMRLTSAPPTGHDSWTDLIAI
jgi:kinetochore protein Spc25, fungi type